MIRTVSLLPLAAGLLSVFLAMLASTASRRRSRTSLLFMLLNVSTAIWSLAYFVQLNTLGRIEPAIQPVGSLPYLLFVLLTFGIAGAPTYWFLFAASYARRERWTRGWRLLLVHLPLIYTLIVATTNPFHHLFVDQVVPGGPTKYGPLAPTHQLFSFFLIGLGIWLLVSFTWRRGTRSAHRQALVLGMAALLPFLGGMAWALRYPLHLPLQVNLSPVLFPVLNLVLAQQILRTGFADIIPYAAFQAFNTISDAIVAIDNDSEIVALNLAAERLLPDVEPSARLIDVAPRLAQHAEACLASESGYVEFELPVGELTYWGRVRRTRDSHGTAMGSIILLTDVTELRGAEAELVELNEELKLRVAELDEAREAAEAQSAELAKTNTQLQEATAAKNRFLTNVSHELRTPLNSIIGFTGMILGGMAGDINDEQRKQLGLVYSSGKHLLNLINDILDLAKIEAGKHELHVERVSAAEVLNSVAGKLGPLAEQKGITLRQECLSADNDLVTDPLRLEQILINLVDNAIKFTDEGGVLLEASRDADSMVFRVIDSGHGIKPKDLGRVFREFEQIVPAGGSKPRGTGLGLSISSHLAEFLGGCISVESTPGVGSTFTVVLPLVIAGQPPILPSAENAEPEIADITPPDADDTPEATAGSPA